MKEDSSKSTRKQKLIESTKDHTQIGPIDPFRRPLPLVLGPCPPFPPNLGHMVDACTWMQSLDLLVINQCPRGASDDKGNPIKLIEFQPYCT